MNHRIPGIVAVGMMASAVLLAHGIPGFSAPPAEAFSDAAARQQVREDARIEILTDVDSIEVDPALLNPGNAANNAATNKQRKPYVRNFSDIAYREARRAGITRPGLFVRQIAAESSFQPCAKSGAGALGIAQIMPATARSWKVDPFIPENALRAAARAMARYEKQLGSYELALAAYNAGPGAVQEYGGVPPYAETRNYIAKIMNRNAPLRGIGETYRLPNDLDPEFARALRSLRQEVRRRGGKLVVNDGLRHYDDQYRLWKAAKRKHGGASNARRWVAPPGCSNHQRGVAADVGGSLNLAHRLAPRYGLVFPMSHEPWHVELRGIATQSG